MTIETWSSRLRHDSDAMFREWGSELSAKLAAVGLVQTSDTGQIDWGTVTRAGSNSNAGYEVWRFDDTQQGTAPIYLRFDYGTASSTSAPRLLVTVGTGSDGSGTITGTALTTARNATGNSAQTSDTSRQSWMCAVDGGFWFVLKHGAAGTDAPYFNFAIFRSCDTDGVPDAEGAQVYWRTTTSNPSSNASNDAQALRFAATAAAYTVFTDASYCLLVNSMTNSVVGANNQYMMHWMAIPRVKPVFGVVSVIPSEVTRGTTFSATPVGSTPRTFISMASSGSNQGSGIKGAANSTSSSDCHPAFIWE